MRVIINLCNQMCYTKDGFKGHLIDTNYRTERQEFQQEGFNKTEGDSGDHYQDESFYYVCQLKEFEREYHSDEVALIGENKWYDFKPEERDSTEQVDLVFVGLGPQEDKCAIVQIANDHSGDNEVFDFFKNPCQKYNSIPTDELLDFNRDEFTCGGDLYDRENLRFCPLDGFQSDIAVDVFNGLCIRIGGETLIYENVDASSNEAYCINIFNDETVTLSDKFASELGNTDSTTASGFETYELIEPTNTEIKMREDFASSTLDVSDDSCTITMTDDSTLTGTANFERATCRVEGEGVFDLCVKHAQLQLLNIEATLKCHGLKAGINLCDRTCHILNEDGEAQQVALIENERDVRAKCAIGNSGVEFGNQDAGFLGVRGSRTKTDIVEVRPPLKLTCDLDSFTCTDADENEGELWLNDYFNGFQVWFPGYDILDLCQNKTISVDYTNVGAFLDNDEYDFGRFSALLLPFKGKCLDASGSHSLTADSALIDLLKLQDEGLTFAIAQDPTSTIACGSNDYHVTEIFFMCNANDVKAGDEQNCPVGMFYNNGECDYCDSTCKTCSGSATSCDECPDDLPHDCDGVCISESEWNNGFFGYAAQCVPCPDFCEECSDEDTCTKCELGTYLVDGMCLLPFECQEYVNEAGSFHYADEDGTCKPCGSDCLTCFKDADFCTMCKDTNKIRLDDGTCLSECGTGLTTVQVGFQCLSCDKSCAKCQDSPNNCFDGSQTTCATGFSEADSSNPDSHFCKQDCNVNGCHKCVKGETDKCAVCVDGKYNDEQTACHDMDVAPGTGKWIFSFDSFEELGLTGQEEQRLIEILADSVYDFTAASSLDKQSPVTLPSHPDACPDATSATGPFPRHCGGDCAGEFASFEKEDGTTICVKHCPEGFRKDGNTCTACPEQPAFADGSLPKCLKCKPQADDSTKIDCLAGDKGVIEKDSNGILKITEECSSDKPIILIIDQIRQCAACDSNCAECKGKPTQCTKCPSTAPFYLEEPFKDFGKCFAEADIPQGYCQFDHEGNFVMKLVPNSQGSCSDGFKCNEPCADCFESPDNCTACPSGQVLQLTPAGENNTCADECASGFMKIKDEEGEFCKKCPFEFAVECDTEGPTVCEGTKVIRKVAGGRRVCVDECANDEYKQEYKKTLNKVQMICDKCSKNCATCKDFATNCDTCPTGQKLQPTKEGQRCFCDHGCTAELSADLTELKFECSKDININTNAFYQGDYTEQTLEQSNTFEIDSTQLAQREDCLNTSFDIIKEQIFSTTDNLQYQQLMELGEDGLEELNKFVEEAAQEFCDSIQSEETVEVEECAYEQLGLTIEDPGEVIFNDETYDKIAPMHFTTYETNDKKGIKYKLSPFTRLNPFEEETVLLLRKGIICRKGCSGDFINRVKINKPTLLPPKVLIESMDTVPSCTSPEIKLTANNFPKNIVNDIKWTVSECKIDGTADEDCKTKVQAFLTRREGVRAFALYNDILPTGDSIEITLGVSAQTEISKKIVKASKVITFNNTPAKLINKTRDMQGIFCPSADKYIDVELELPTCTSGANMWDILESKVSYEVKVLDGQCNTEITELQAEFFDQTIFLARNEEYTKAGGICVRLIATPETTNTAQNFDFRLKPKCPAPKIYFVDGDFITASKSRAVSFDVSTRSRLPIVGIKCYSAESTWIEQDTSKLTVSIPADTYKGGDLVEITCEARDNLGNVATNNMFIEYTNANTSLSGRIVVTEISGRQLKLVPQDDNGNIIDTSGCKWRFSVDGSTTAGTTIERGTKSNTCTFHDNNVLVMHELNSGIDYKFAFDCGNTGIITTKYKAKVQLSATLVVGQTELTTTTETTVTINIDNSENVEYVTYCLTIFKNENGNLEERPFGLAGPYLEKVGFFPYEGEVTLKCFVINTENGAYQKLEQKLNVIKSDISVDDATDLFNGATNAAEAAQRAEHLVKQAAELSQEKRTEVSNRLEKWINDLMKKADYSKEKLSSNIDIAYKMLKMYVQKLEGSETFEIDIKLETVKNIIEFVTFSLGREVEIEGAKAYNRFITEEQSYTIYDIADMLWIIIEYAGFTDTEKEEILKNVEALTVRSQAQLIQESTAEAVQTVSENGSVATNAQHDTTAFKGEGVTMNLPENTVGTQGVRRLQEGSTTTTSNKTVSVNMKPNGEVKGESVKTQMNTLPHSQNKVKEDSSFLSEEEKQIAQCVSMVIDTYEVRTLASVSTESDPKFNDDNDLAFTSLTLNSDIQTSLDVDIEYMCNKEEIVKSVLKQQELTEEEINEEMKENLDELWCELKAHLQMQFVDTEKDNAISNEGITREEPNEDDECPANIKFESTHQTEFVFYIENQKSLNIERFYKGVIIFALLLINIYLLVGVIYGCKKDKKNVKKFFTVANESNVTQNDLAEGDADAGEVKVKPVNNFVDKDVDTTHTMHTEANYIGAKKQISFCGVFTVYSRLPNVCASFTHELLTPARVFSLCLQVVFLMGLVGVACHFLEIISTWVDAALAFVAAFIVMRGINLFANSLLLCQQKNGMGMKIVIVSFLVLLYLGAHAGIVMLVLESTDADFLAWSVFFLGGFVIEFLVWEMIVTCYQMSAAKTLKKNKKPCCSGFVSNAVKKAFV